MKAIVQHEFGGPGVLKLEEVPTPVPGPGQVLMRVHAVSVSRRDLRVTQNMGNYGQKVPLTPGSDPSGVCEAVGAGVESVKPGDRITTRGLNHCNQCDACKAGNYRQCTNRPVLGLRGPGAFAEYVLIGDYSVVQIPDGVSYADATLVLRHFPLAYSQVKRAELKEGEWALVMGATGGVGQCIVQVAKEYGAKVIGAAGADERVAAAQSIGADAGINYRKEDLAKRVMEITEGHGVDVVFENVGDPELWPGAFNSLAADGRLVTVGAIGGVPMPLDVERLYQRRLRVIGGTGGDTPEDTRHAFEMAAAGKFHMLIDCILPMSQVAEGYRKMEDRNVIGKILLDPTRL